MDDQARENIQDDLKGFVKGEVLFDDLTRALYSTDASVFQVTPLGVISPRDEEDVQNVVRYAAEHRLALVPRGAGTGLAGEALGSGLVLDLSCHFRSIAEIGADSVRVQPGVVCREVNRRLREVGRRLGPDPATAAECTVGGMVATNASGAHLLRHGYMRDHVLALRAVLDTGDAVAVGRHARELPAGASAGHLEDIVFAVGDLIEKNAELIRSCRPRTPFDRCAYLLHDVLSAEGLDLAKLLTGSEGTLALFTEATLRTIAVPSGRSLILLGFESQGPALKAALGSLATGPAACELVDSRLLALARSSDASLAALLPAGCEVVLLVEYERDSPEAARRAAAELTAALRGDGLAPFAHVASEDAEIDRIWNLRDAAWPSLHGVRGKSRPVPFIEDVGVAAEELPALLHRVQEILQQFETSASFLVHAGTGQLQTRPFLDLEQPGDQAKLWAIAEQVHTLALSMGGTVSTQHGTGLARTPWVERQYGPLYAVLRGIKEIFDPNRIFNPGKIIAMPGDTVPWKFQKTPALVPAGAASTGAGPGETKPVARILIWQQGELDQEIANCNGCGHCRTRSAPERMCPIFRVTGAEAATPRAKVNLMRHVLQNGTQALSSNEVRAVADLCVNCKMCALECPTHVDIPRLMLEAKAANVAEHGLDRAEWVMARAESLAALGSSLAPIVNHALASRPLRWFLEKIFGISRKRRLPSFAKRSFLERATRRGWTLLRRSRRVRAAYFVDVFANYNDPQVAEATVAVLHHQGIDVHIPAGQIGSGMAPLAQGDVETAREVARTNLRHLAELAREGYWIVCSEPTAALMLCQEYPRLIDDADSRLVARRTRELTSFLLDFHAEARLQTDFQPVELAIGHHVPCHMKALGADGGGARLLGLVPGFRVRTIDVSCSGMAGTFGLRADNYQASLAAGRPMLDELKRPDTPYGSTECSSCRLQMEDGTGKRTLHPVQYLAMAYGLMPEIEQRLRAPIRELVLQ